MDQVTFSQGFPPLAWPPSRGRARTRTHTPGHACTHTHMHRLPSVSQASSAEGSVSFCFLSCFSSELFSVGYSHTKKCKNIHNKQFHSNPSLVYPVLPPPLTPVTVFIGFVCILPKFRYENTSIYDFLKKYFPPLNTKVPHIHSSVFLLLRPAVHRGVRGSERFSGWCAPSLALLRGICWHAQTSFLEPSSFDRGCRVSRPLLFQTSGVCNLVRTSPHSRLCTSVGHVPEVWLCWVEGCMHSKCSEIL